MYPSLSFRYSRNSLCFLSDIGLILLRFFSFVTFPFCSLYFRLQSKLIQHLGLAYHSFSTSLLQKLHFFIPPRILVLIPQCHIRASHTLPCFCFHLIQL